MPCPGCGSPEGDFSRYCTACIEKMRLRREAGASQLRNRPSKVSGPPVFTPGSVICLLVFFLSVLLFLNSRGTFGYGSFPKVQLASVRGGSGEDPCSGRRHCIVALLAPWCSACHGSIPFLKDMRTRLASNPDIGVKVIVGLGEQEQLQGMAQEIGGQVFLDTDNRFASAIGYTAVPAWWVVEPDMKIYSKGTGLGVSGGTADENFSYFTKRLLKIM